MTWDPDAEGIGPRKGETWLQTVARLAEELHGVPLGTEPVKSMPKPFEQRMREIWEGPAEPGEEV